MMMKKLIALLLVVVMVLSLVACNSNKPDETKGTDSTDSTAGTDNTDSTDPTEPEPVKADVIDLAVHEENSEAAYEAALGEFAEYYAKAKAEMDDLDLRVALMALAEAKMYESGAFLPIQSHGGSYSMSRVVPRTTTTLSWGNDGKRYHNLLITNEILKAEDRAALVEIWDEAADADEWYANAKAFLTENGYTLKTEYAFAYSDSISTWDTIATSYASDSEFIAPTYSPLFEYDAKNNQQPALAESVKVSDDGLVYTFTIRQGVKWVDQQGREYAEVTADDWVASMQHLADNVDASGYLMTASEGCGIKSFEEYLNGEITDFNEVGVKAIDTYTLEYTLEAPFPAFMTMVGYGVFAPLCRDYYKSQGGTFGADGDDYTSGDYGIDPSHILYNGPFLITNYTENVTIKYEANPTYWAKDVANNQNITSIVNTFNDGSDSTRNYRECKDGVVDSTALTAENLVSAKQEKPDGEDGTYFELYSYISATDGTTFCGWYNMNRSMYTNWDDISKAVSDKNGDADEQARTRAAMSNRNFRLALTYGLDRGAYNGVLYGEDLKYARLRNTYTPGDFMALGKDVTVDINGTATTFKAGTYYGEMVQAQLTADGSPIKCWDPNGNDGMGSSDSFDGWYNVENARAALEQAIEELAAEGVEITAANPIHIDYPYGSYQDNSTKQANAYKQSIEASLEGKVFVNLVACEDSHSLQSSYYRLRDGRDANYDISTGSGWGPDYGDPQTFLDTIQWEGYMTKNCGMW